MASITQDMRYRLSLIRYAEKYGVTKAAIKYKTNRQYIYRWNAGIMALGTLCAIVPDALTTILTSILLRKSGSFKTCADAIPMPDSLSSG